MGLCTYTEVALEVRAASAVLGVNEGFCTLITRRRDLNDSKSDLNDVFPGITESSRFFQNKAGNITSCYSKCPGRRRNIEK